MYSGMVLLLALASFFSLNAPSPSQTATQNIAKPDTLRDQNGRQYNAWLEQDVRWIIRSDEVKAFKQLTDDEQRELFIEQFWESRRPKSEQLGNEFKLEHYRRLLYAREHFGEPNQGWSTDRARAYVVLGRPDSIDRRTIAVESADRNVERWRYAETKQHSALEIQFVDFCSCGQFKLTEESRAVLDHASNPELKPPDGLELIDVIGSQPQPKFKDLQQVVAHKIKIKMLPISVSAAFEPITDATNMVTLHIDGVCATQPLEPDHPDCNSLRYFGRITAITGRVLETFEGTASCDKNGRQMNHCSTDRQMPLPKGIVRVDLAVSDLDQKRCGTASQIIKAN